MHVAPPDVSRGAKTVKDHGICAAAGLEQRLVLGLADLATPGLAADCSGPPRQQVAAPEAVVAAAAPHGVPVTLKMRTGWADQAKNAPSIALGAEAAGVQMLTVHGRTREQGYKGVAEYDTIAAVKAALRIPVVANGDIDSPEKALQVLKYTGADALMVGRAAQGRPWIFREIVHFLATGEHLAPPLVAEVKRALLAHLQDHYGLYGELTGVRSARKHIAWYVRDLPGGDVFRDHMNTLETADLQSRAVADFFEEMASHTERMPQAFSGTRTELALETME